MSNSLSSDSTRKKTAEEGQSKDVVVVTGSSGFIGAALVKKLAMFALTVEIDFLSSESSLETSDW
jgi:NAD(P)H-hydrate repair Nnr-like enzyme with NAD(P)H-hydrate dehydratase domain